MGLHISSTQGKEGGRTCPLATRGFSAGMVSFHVSPDPEPIQSTKITISWSAYVLHLCSCIYMCSCGVQYIYVVTIQVHVYALSHVAMSNTI